MPPQRPDVPAVRNPKPPVHNPIDAFVRAKLAEKGIAPSRPADKLTLIRRLTLDLTGLPPTPAEVDVFLKDDSPAAQQMKTNALALAAQLNQERWQIAVESTSTLPWPLVVIPVFWITFLTFVSQGDSQV